MSIITPVTPEKKEFIRFIGAGLGTLMNCSMVSDEIYIGQDDDNETYIKDNILVGSSFCANKWFVAKLSRLDSVIKSHKN